LLISKSWDAGRIEPNPDIRSSGAERSTFTR